MGDAIETLQGPERERAVPLVIAAFTGIYRWHAKRTLREVAEVRGWVEGSELLGVAMLEPLAPEVGYVYYLIVAPARRGQRIGSRLLEDALARFRADGRSVAYAVTGRDNDAMVAMLRSHGFRSVARRETGYRDGGLGAWGIRSQMRIVPGETLFGRRLDAPP